MSTSIEAQGHTVDEAIQIALNQLGVSRDKVEIDILHHPRRGVLGIGARRAKVRATIRQAVMPDGEEFDMSGGADIDDKPRRRRRRGGRNRGRGEEGSEQTAPRPAGAPRTEERRGESERRGDQQGQRGGREGQPQRSEGGRGRDDRRGGRGRDQRQEGQRGREQSAPRGQQNAGRDQRQRPDAQRAEGQREGDQRGRDQQRGDRREGRDQQGRGQQQGRRDRDDRRERGPRPEQIAPAEPEAAGQTSFEGQPQSFEGAEQALPAARAHGDFAEMPASAPAPRRERERERVEEVPLDAEALDAIRARAEELVRELLEKMGFPAEVSSSIDEAAGEAVVSVRSESEGLLIGRRGQTLDSLEHIVNRMTLRADAYVEGRVLLDIGDYRKRRRESLDELATRLRTRAVTERRTVQVSPMSPRDRKFFAQVFAGDDAVEVRALGAGFYRRVIVAPAGAPPGAISETESASDIEDESLENESFAGSEAES